MTYQNYIQAISQAAEEAIKFVASGRRYVPDRDIMRDSENDFPFLGEITRGITPESSDPDTVGIAYMLERTYTIAHVLLENPFTNGNAPTIEDLVEVDGLVADNDAALMELMAADVPMIAECVGSADGSHGIAVAGAMLVQWAQQFKDATWTGDDEEVPEIIDEPMTEGLDEILETMSEADQPQEAPIYSMDSTAASEGTDITLETLAELVSDTALILAKEQGRLCIECSLGTGVDALTLSERVAMFSRVAAPENIDVVTGMSNSLVLRVITDIPVPTKGIS